MFTNYYSFTLNQITMYIKQSIGLITYNERTPITIEEIGNKIKENSIEENQYLSGVLLFRNTRTDIEIDDFLIAFTSIYYKYDTSENDNNISFDLSNFNINYFLKENLTDVSRGFKFDKKNFIKYFYIETDEIYMSCEEFIRKYKSLLKTITSYLKLRILINKDKIKLAFIKECNDDSSYKNWTNYINISCKSIGLETKTYDLYKVHSVLGG